MIQKPLKAFEIDPEAFILLIKSFIKSYPQYSWDLKNIAEKGEQELDKINFFKKKGLNFNEENVNYSDYTSFWDHYLTIEDTLAANHIIKNPVFEEILKSHESANSNPPPRHAP